MKARFGGLTAFNMFFGAIKCDEVVPVVKLEAEAVLSDVQFTHFIAPKTE
jgi:hypothetical protein